MLQIYAPKFSPQTRAEKNQTPDQLPSYIQANPNNNNWAVHEQNVTKNETDSRKKDVECT